MFQPVPFHAALQLLKGLDEYDFYGNHQGLSNDPQSRKGSQHGDRNQKDAGLYLRKPAGRLLRADGDVGLMQLVKGVGEQNIFQASLFRQVRHSSRQKNLKLPSSSSCSR